MSAIVYTDGSSQGNRQRGYNAGAGWVIIDAGYGTEVGCGGKHLFSCDATEAEMHAVILGVEDAVRRKYRHLKVRTDSITVIEWMAGTREPNPSYRRLVDLAHRAGKHATVSYERVSRSQVKRAHNLAQAAAGIADESPRLMDGKESNDAIQIIYRIRRHFKALYAPTIHRLYLGREDDLASALAVLHSYDEDFRANMDMLYQMIEQALARSVAGESADDGRAWMDASTLALAGAAGQRAPAPMQPEEWGKIPVAPLTLMDEERTLYGEIEYVSPEDYGI